LFDAFSVRKSNPEMWIKSSAHGRGQDAARGGGSGDQVKVLPEFAVYLLLQAVRPDGLMSSP
jgi:hypothetical protein